MVPALIAAMISEVSVPPLVAVAALCAPGGGGFVAEEDTGV